MGSKSNNTSEALFSKTRRRLLDLLFGQTDRSFYANEIVRSADVGVGAVQRELEKLSSGGLLTSTKVGNRKYYQANPDCPLFEELRAIVAKTTDRNSTRTDPMRKEKRGRLQVPKTALAELCKRHHIQKLSLFGSAVRRDFSPDSDIDLLVEFRDGKAPSLGGFVELQEELSTLLGERKVDLATPSILNNPYRRRAITRDLKELYAA